MNYLIPILLLAGAAGAQVTPDPKLRANRDTYHPALEVLKETPAPEVTGEQLAKLKTFPFEAIWGAVQRAGYVNSHISGLKASRPGDRMVGRALTIRYLPKRPDLEQAMQKLSREGNWPGGYHVRAGEQVKPGDVIVVDLGGDIPTGVFFGDVSALAAKTRGARGVVLWGSSRDLGELREMEGLPVYAVGFDPRPALQMGVDWNVPIRIGPATVLPGDVVVAEEEAVLFFPPSILGQVVEAAERTVEQETFERERVKEQKHRFRDIYPLSPELRKRFEEERRKK